MLFKYYPFLATRWWQWTVFLLADLPETLIQCVLHPTRDASAQRLVVTAALDAEQRAQRAFLRAGEPPEQRAQRGELSDTTGVQLNHTTT